MEYAQTTQILASIIITIFAIVTVVAMLKA